MIDKIMKLIALTASPNENEARNAAFLACRLIREGGLEVVERREERRDIPNMYAYEDMIRKAYTRPHQPPKQQWHAIRAQFGSKCGGCGCAIDVGEQIWWKRDCKARCLICGKPKE